MKFTVAVLLALVAVASAQLHHGSRGHAVARGHVGGGHLGGGHHRMGRSLRTVVPVARVGHVGVIGGHGLHGGLAHHRMGRSILLSRPVVPVWNTGLLHPGVLSHGMVSNVHGLLL